MSLTLEGGHDVSLQQELTVGRLQLHISASLKHCSHKEMFGQQSPQSKEQRSFRRQKTNISITSAPFYFSVVTNRNTVQHLANQDKTIK